MTDNPDTGRATPAEHESDEPAAAPAAEEPAPRDEEAGPEHAVQDSYVARRLAQEAAERATAARPAGADAALTEDEVSDSPVGFYMALGVMVAAVLLVVIWLAGTRPEATATLIERRPPAAGSREAPGAPPGPARTPVFGAAPGMASGARRSTPPLQTSPPETPAQTGTPAAPEAPPP